MRRWAAAGANTSRPANVGPGAGSWYSGLVERDRALGAARQRDSGREQPVVRPDQHALALRHLDGDGGRSVATPGSTTPSTMPGAT